MSDKKKALDWAAEILADSGTPDGDDFQWGQGSNYGLDGHHFEQTQGKDRPAQPGATPGPPPGSSAGSNGMQSLPGGLMASVQAPLDEAALMNDFSSGLQLGEFFERDAAAVDLSWLDPTQGQDPDRLPVGPDDKGLEELEGAWGFGRRTDGVNRVPTKDLAAERYHQRMNKSPQPATPGPKLAAEDMSAVRRAAQKAVRDAHFGKSVAEIKRDLVASLGDKAAHTRGVVSHLKQDAGLVGNVFVRASAFPGIKNGKWVQDIKRKARGARYVITDDPTVGTKLGMIAVSEVPWKGARNHYAPRLRAAGYSVDMAGDPRAALRAAFQTGPAAAEVPLQRPKPVEVRPADTITAKEALAQFHAAAPKALPTLPSRDGSQARRAKALGKLAKWMSAGSLSAEQVFDLRKLQTDDMLIRAGEMVNAPKEGTYEGAGVSHTLNAQMERQASQGVLTKTAEFQRLASWTRKAMNEGWMGGDLDQLLNARWSSEVLREAAPELRELRARHEGLAGNVYVDAAAYASTTGTQGCKAASATHRTNQVRRVLAMSRCGSCVHRQAMLDGTGHCSVYNKPLIKASDLGPDRLKVIQDEAIKLSNASDAEITGSLFTSRHTSLVSEFGLQASMDVSLNDTPTVEKLGELLFDGLYVNTREDG